MFVFGAAVLAPPAILSGIKALSIASPSTGWIIASGAIMAGLWIVGTAGLGIAAARVIDLGDGPDK